MWDKNLSVKDNLKYLSLELTFSLQLTELLTDTNSLEVQKTGATKLSDAGKSDNGMVADLSKFIPATLMTKLCEKQLAELLYYKFYKSYGFLTESDERYLPSGVPAGADVSANTFRLNKKMAHQLVPYRGKVNLIWTVSETIIATVTYLSTKSLELTLLLTGISEFFRRFRI